MSTYLLFYEMKTHVRETGHKAWAVELTETDRNGEIRKTSTARFTCLNCVINNPDKYINEKREENVAEGNKVDDVDLVDLRTVSEPMSDGDAIEEELHEVHRRHNLSNVFHYEEETLISAGYEKCTPEFLEKYPDRCLNEPLAYRRLDNNGSHWHKTTTVKNVKPKSLSLDLEPSVFPVPPPIVLRSGDSMNLTSTELITDDWRAEPDFTSRICGYHHQQLSECIKTYAAGELGGRCYIVRSGE